MGRGTADAVKGPRGRAEDAPASARSDRPRRSAPSPAAPVLPPASRKGDEDAKGPANPPPIEHRPALRHSRLFPRDLICPSALSCSPCCCSPLRSPCAPSPPPSPRPRHRRRRRSAPRCAPTCCATPTCWPRRSTGCRPSRTPRRSPTPRPPSSPTAKSWSTTRATRVLGNPAGAVSVVEFFDYRCPYCRAFEPSLEAIVAANPDVRLVLKEFPILDVEDSSHISEGRRARRAGRQGPGAASAVVHPRPCSPARAWTRPASPRFVEDRRLRPRRRQGARGEPGGPPHQLADIHALAHALGVDGTPAFVVGDRMIPGADPDALRQAIAAARAAAPPALRR